MLAGVFYGTEGRIELCDALQVCETVLKIQGWPLGDAHCGKRQTFLLRRSSRGCLFSRIWGPPAFKC